MACRSCWQGMKAMFSRTHGNALHAWAFLQSGVLHRPSGWTAHPTVQPFCFALQAITPPTVPWTPWIWSAAFCIFLPFCRYSDSSIVYPRAKGTANSLGGFSLLGGSAMLIPSYSDVIALISICFISKTDLFMHSLLRISGPNINVQAGKMQSMCIPVASLPRIWGDKWSALQLFVFTSDCGGCCSTVLFTTACQILKV